MIELVSEPSIALEVFAFIAATLVVPFITVVVMLLIIGGK